MEESVTPTIGALYEIGGSIFFVSENNLIKETTTLKMINTEKKIQVPVSLIVEKEPLGPVFPVNGKVVIEDGKQFVKLPNQKSKH